MSPDSPQTVAFDDMADSSVPLSPNRVQVGKSQDIPGEGSLFNVSPVTPGFLMRPSGALGSSQGLVCRYLRSWILLLTLYSEIRLLLHNAL